jgi:hypothetical protein
MYIVSLALSSATDTAYTAHQPFSRVTPPDIWPYPEVVSTVDIPLNIIPMSLRRKRVKSVVFTDPAALLICPFLVFLVVSMVPVEQIAELANLVFHVSRLNLNIVEMGFPELFAKVGERMLDLPFEAMMLL